MTAVLRLITTLVAAAALMAFGCAAGIHLCTEKHRTECVCKGSAK